MKPEMKREEEMESRSSKKGMTSAMIKATMVMKIISDNQVIQPNFVLMKRITEFLKMRP